MVSYLSGFPTSPRAPGIGRVDIVESRFVGMKSRGVYETPGGTVLLTARRAIESICLDRGEAHLKVGGALGGFCGVNQTRAFPFFGCQWAL